MKLVWAAAAAMVLGYLWVLAGGSSGSGAGAPATASATPAQPEYFTQEDPARSRVDYGVRENGETTIYNSLLVK